MGARRKNFYNELARRYGFEAESEKIQDLYLAGRKAEATAAIPEELLRGTSLVGTADEVKARIAAYRDAGVTTLAVSFAGVPDPDRRLRLIEHLAELGAQRWRRAARRLFGCELEEAAGRFDYRHDLVDGGRRVHHLPAFSVSASAPTPSSSTG
jgi:hypothetical protein